MLFILRFYIFSSADGRSYVAPHRRLQASFKNITAEEAEQFVAGIESLQQIDGVIGIQCGEITKTAYPNYNDRTKGYTHSLSILLRDVDALQRFDSDPFHDEVKQKWILPLIDKQADSPVLVFDYFGKLPEVVGK
eukprot:gene8936-9859_t